MARKMKGLVLKRSNTSSTSKSSSRHRIGDHADQVSATNQILSETASGFLKAETTSGASKTYAKAESLATAAKRMAVEAGKFASSQILATWPNVAEIGSVWVISGVPISIRSDRRSFVAFYLLDAEALTTADRKKGKRIVDPATTDDLAEKIGLLPAQYSSEETYWRAVDTARAERVREALEVKQVVEAKVVEVIVNGTENAGTENGAAESLVS